MKTIKIFIASSSELKSERMELVDLLMDLSQETISKSRGVKLEPVLWEFMDSSMREQRKEDEYLEELKKCEICFVLFWKTLGEYTKEELDVAMAEMSEGLCPRVVRVLYKEPANGRTSELLNFMEGFSQRYPTIPESIFDSITSLRYQVTQIISTYL